MLESLKTHFFEKNIWNNKNADLFLSKRNRNIYEKGGMPQPREQGDQLCWTLRSFSCRLKRLVSEWAMAAGLEENVVF